MCGIAGMVRFDGAPVDTGAVRAMTAALAHRGPDAEGAWTDGRAAFGHRRLAVIDLSEAAAQPMEDPDGRGVLDYNGEVYNHAALRAELSAGGTRFRSRSDTEAVAALLAAEGAAALQRMQGMWGLAWWRRRERRLLLARDPLGMKPLYWMRRGGMLAFASELKALRLLLDGAEIDPEALADYLTWQAVSPPRTILRGVQALPPGCLLEADAEGRVDVRPYWRLASPPRADDPRGKVGSGEDWAGGLRARLDEAVESHLDADVPVGAFLSGGLDSSLLSALAARKTRLETFSIGFDVPAYDESAEARRVAGHIGSRHHLFRMGAADASDLEAIVEHMDEPFGDSSILPTWRLCAETRRHVTVALAGDGSDEQLLGYFRHADFEREAAWDRLPGVVLRAVARAARPFARRDAAAFLARLDLPPGERFVAANAYHDAAALGSLLSPELAADLASYDAAAEVRRLVSREGLAGVVRRELTRYLPDVLLSKVDRASMAFGLEVRLPFLHRPLVEYLASMPLAERRSGGVGKRVLREAASGLLPPRTIHRAKQGFTVPVKDWLRGGLKPMAEELLLGRPLRERGWLRPAEVGRLLGEHVSGRANHARKLWLLMVLEAWCRGHLDAGAPVRRGAAA